uniref:Ig-like domain-containing protein n=1 Tax=Oncorhynchus tshawytscha TaxID=74940 RepID=A0A8C8LUB9_ONCTS
MKTFPTSAVWCFGILFISVSLITTGSSDVVGPADPVVALAGDDVILPCSLKPSVSAEDMVVKWTGLYLKTKNVHLYRDGRDSNKDQSPSYKGRTSMFHEELKNGIVSLKLNIVTLSDAGSYRCFIPTLTSQVKETTVQLFVGVVSQPVISIGGTKGWGVVLKCESGGWFPKPEMEWLDSSGTILPADGAPEIYRDSEDLYAVRRHVTVNKTDTNRFTCRVQQPEINHLKETKIHVSDDMFPKSQVGLIIGLSILLAVVVLVASAGVYKWRKHVIEKRFRTMKMFHELLERHSQIMFVDIHKDDLIQSVTMVIPIAFYLIHSDGYSEIHAATTRKDQMTLLYQALEEAEDSMVKSDFYRILLDLEPDVVNHPGRPKDSDEEDLYLDELVQNLPGQLEKIRKHRGKAEETIKSLSTSSGGQHETQTPSQNESEIEEMEIKSLPGPGRKSAPEMESLLDELEMGGRVTLDNNYML